MALTSAQLTIFAADIAANTATINGVAINALPQTQDNAFEVAKWYNQYPQTDFFANYSTVPINDVKNAVTFKNFTPVDAVPTDTALNATIHLARTMVCQSYQINVNNLLTAGTVIDATKTNIYQAWKDCTQNVPAGVAGANVSGGWANIQKILCKKATNIQKLFASTTSGNGSSNTTAATMTFEGSVSPSDINAIWGI